MKQFKSWFSLILVFIMSVSLFSCSMFNSTEQAGIGMEALYNMAVESGYTDSFDNFLAQLKGEQGEKGDTGAQGEKGEKGDTGAQGEKGEKGDTGAQGEKGDTGAEGAAGKDGATWLTGEGEPDEAVGSLGDLYFDMASCDIYQKLLQGWTAIANVKGDEGEGTTVNEGDNYEITVNTDSVGAAAASKALLSVVSIRSTFTKGSNSTEKYSSAGSGVIYSLDKDAGDAYIITNYHVIYDYESTTEGGIAQDIFLYIYGLEYSDFGIRAEFLGGSMTYDIAVLKVSESDILRSSTAVAATVSDSSDVRVLDTAIAIGNPEAAGISATLGSISVESEYITSQSMDGDGTIDYRVMRIDTAINGGNSGGGLFNTRGELIGIVNAKKVGTDIDNIAYAIPSNLAVAVAENIIRNCDGSTNMSVQKCMIGITVIISNPTVSYDEQTQAVIVTNDVLIISVKEDGVAYGKLFADNVIKSVTIGDKCFDIKHNYDVGEALLYASEGDEVVFGVVDTDGEPMSVPVIITEASITAIK